MAIIYRKVIFKKVAKEYLHKTFATVHKSFSLLFVRLQWTNTGTLAIGSRLGQPSVDFSKVFICLRQNFCSGNLEQKVQVYLVRIVRATSASVWSCFERSGPISRKVEISSLILFSTWVLSPWIRSKTSIPPIDQCCSVSPFQRIFFPIPRCYFLLRSFHLFLPFFPKSLPAFPKKKIPVPALRTTLEENDGRKFTSPPSFLTMTMRVRLNERCFPAKKIRRFLPTILNFNES